jgi:GNAT superfamily N-acetyltransferase
MREASQQDERGIAALAVVAGGSGWWGWEQRTGPDHPDRRRHVELDGERVVGYGAVWRRKGTIFGLDTLVHPSARGAGLGRRLIEVLFEDLAKLGATAVEARIDADHKDALTFMVRRGFVELNRLERVRLDLGDVKVEESRPEGITVTTLGEMRDPRALDALVKAAFRERPVRYLEPFTEPPSEQFATELAGAFPDGSFLAMSGSDCVGFSGLMPGPEPGTVTAFMTATLPDHRHRGIATALKRRAIAWAKQNGLRAIFSNSPNPDMQELNEMLGFQRCAAAEIRMGRRLTTSL